MKQLKKLICLMLVAALLCSMVLLTACGSKEETGSDESKPDSTQQPTEKNPEQSSNESTQTPGSSGDTSKLPDNSDEPSEIPGSSDEPSEIPGSSDEPSEIPGSSEEPSTDPNGTTEEPIEPPVPSDPCANGHTAGDWVIDENATATTDGKKHQVCSVCGITVKEEIIPAIGSVGLTYQINPDYKTCTVIGMGDCTDKDLFIPQVIDGYIVTAIDSYAFGYTELTSVKLPQTLISLGESSFPENLFQVENGVSYLDKWAVACDSNITKVTLREDTVGIGDYAFCFCDQITEVVIPNSIKSIGNDAFRGCNALTTLTIPEGVLYIDDNAFLSCENLTNISLPESLIHIGNGAFVGCNKLRKTTLDHTEYLGNASNPYLYLKKVNSSFRGTSFTIPSTTRIIAEEAFVERRTITNLTMPDSVVSIGENAFAGCSGITAITLSKNLLIIGDYAFTSCESLTEIKVPDSVISLGDYAFAACYNVKSIVIGNGITSIGYYTFNSCHGLENLVLPHNLKNIDDCGLWYCQNFKEIYYTGTETEWSAVSINESAFNSDNPPTVFYYSETDPGATGNYWHYLGDIPAVWGRHYHTVVIDSAVEPTCTQNGKTEGSHCATCGEVFIAQTEIPAKHNVVMDYGTDATCTQDGKTNGSHCTVCGEVFVKQEIIPAGHTETVDPAIPPTCVQTGKTEGKHCTVCGEIIVPQIDLGMGDHVYSNESDETCNSCGNIRIVEAKGLTYTVNADNISCTITGIGSCSNQHLHIPKSIDGYTVTEIGGGAFEFCNNLISVTIPDSVITINGIAFKNCEMLTTVVIPESVTGIRVGAFLNCFRLKSVSIPDSVTILDESVFENCTDLTNVTLGNGITAISDRLFKKCENMTSIVLPDNITSIGNYAFDSCTKLTNVVIPDGVTSIGVYAFAYCHGFTKVCIPDNVVNIGMYAFFGCPSLETVILPRSVTKIGSYAFQACTGLKAFYYDGTAQEWQKIKIEGSNYLLNNTSRYYFSETRPTDTANKYWHYVDGIPTAW